MAGRTPFTSTVTVSTKHRTNRDVQHLLSALLLLEAGQAAGVAGTMGPVPWVLWLQAGSAEEPAQADVAAQPRFPLTPSWRCAVRGSGALGSAWWKSTVARFGQTSTLSVLSARTGGGARPQKQKTEPRARRKTTTDGRMRTYCAWARQRTYKSETPDDSHSQALVPVVVSQHLTVSVTTRMLRVRVMSCQRYAKSRRLSVKLNEDESEP